MGTNLIIGSVIGSQLGSNVNPAEYLAYLERVIADGGVIDDTQFTLDYLKFLKQQNILDNTKLLIAPEMGTKRRVSGVNTYLSKAYSPKLPINDAFQSTELSQPWLSGNIAPNERLALKNPNGGSRFLTHPDISFGVNEAWSVSFVVSLFGDRASNYRYIGSNSGVFGLHLTVNSNDSGIVLYTNGSPSSISSANLTLILNKRKSKTTIITITYNNSEVNFFIEKDLVQTISATTVALFQGLYPLRYGSNAKGITHQYRIQSGAMTPEQVTAEYNFLRARFPEIESVQIGTQTWATSNLEMVATPQGNVIPEMQANAAVVKLNDTFDSTTGWILPTGTSISGSKLVFTNAAWVMAYRTGITVLGKWYKCTLTVESITSGALALTITGNSANISSAGTYTFYLKNTTSGGTLVGITATSDSTNAVVDNFIVEELGWANSTEIYDAVYAATVGTVEQKTYAAVKEAAMWCHHSNDVTLGAIYGKLYNWYAAKLLQMDIDFYNSANPTALWGWKLPNQSNIFTLRDALGGRLVAGGKMKVAGFDYFNSPNTGADNSSGFSMLGAGWRSAVGTFSGIKADGVIWTLHEFTATNAYAPQTISYTNEFPHSTDNSTNAPKASGFPLRLLKS